MDQSPTEPYVSPRNAARRLGISKATLYKHYYPAILRGEIKALWIGTAVRIEWISLLAYIEAESRRNVQARMHERR